MGHIRFCFHAAGKRETSGRAALSGTVPTATQCAAAVSTATVPTAWGGVAVVALNSALVGPCKVVWCPVLPPFGLTQRCCTETWRRERERKNPSRDTALEELKISTDNKSM